MKKIVISGATSMIGLALINSCIANSINCLCLVRNNSPKIADIPLSPLVQVLECSLELMSRYVPIASETNCDAFFHLGWEGTSQVSRDDAAIQCKNITYTLDAVQLAKKFGCRCFIGVGSQAEYGLYNGTISPEMPTNPETAYGAAKLCAGRLSSIICKNLGIRHIWARVFSIYGPFNQENTLISSLINSFSLAEPPKLTPAEQMWDYLYVEDAATALRLLAEKENAKGVYNVGSGVAHPLRHYVEIVRNAINPDIMPLYGAVPYSEKQVMHLCADISSLAADTGFVPKYSFEQGIKRTLCWLNDVTRTVLAIPKKGDS